jgi:hypothetical protein
VVKTSPANLTTDLRPVSGYDLTCRIPYDPTMSVVLGELSLDRRSSQDPWCRTFLRADSRGEEGLPRRRLVCLT